MTQVEYVKSNLFPKPVYVGFLGTESDRWDLDGVTMVAL